MSGEGQGNPDAEAVFAAAAASGGDAVVGTTLDGTVFMWSPAAQRMLGYAADEAGGRHLARLFVDDHRGAVGSWLERAVQGDNVHETTALVSKSGEPVDVALTVAPVREGSGAVQAICVVARDLTEPHWLARNLDSSLSALESALAEAREAEGRCRRILGDAAHQLRNPIATVQACAQTLLAAESTPERDRLLAALVRETTRAGELLGALLRLARLDEGEMPVPEPCDVVELCADEADRTWTLAPKLDVVLRADVPGRALLDPRAVREIVANLLDNARRYADHQIEVEARVVDGRLELTVRDDGPGLPAETAEQAFERFVTLDPKGRSGLGLPIARDLARAHGGNLVYEAGAFVLRLPYEPAASAGS